MESDETTRARAELAALQTDRTAMADRARQPWWYDPALGLLVFGFFSSYSLGFPWAPLVALVPFLIGMRLLVAAYQRRTGFWVNGLREGETRRAAWVWLALAGVVLVVGLVGQLVLGWTYAMVVAGAVLGLTVALVSRWWTTIYQRELRSGV